MGYAWSSLRAVRPQLAGIAGPMAGVALLLAVRLMGLQVCASRYHLGSAGEHEVMIILRLGGLVGTAC